MARIEERTREPTSGSEFEHHADVTWSVIVDLSVLPSAPSGYNFSLTLTSMEGGRLAATGNLAFLLAPGDSFKQYFAVEHVDASGGGSVYDVKAVLSALPIGSADQIELIVLGENGSWQYTVV